MKNLFVVICCVIFSLTANAQTGNTPARQNGVSISLESLADAKSLQWDKLEKVFTREVFDGKRDFALTIKVELTDAEVKALKSPYEMSNFEVAVSDEPDSKKRFQELKDGVTQMIAFLEGK
jgi:hypothetical protein